MLRAGNLRIDYVYRYLFNASNVITYDVRLFDM